MKLINKGKIEVKFSVLKLLSQNFEVSTPRGDIINPEVGQKAQKLVFPVSILIERRKSKVKETLRWIIRLWNRSLKILKFWLNLVTSSGQN